MTPDPPTSFPKGRYNQLLQPLLWNEAEALALLMPLSADYPHIEYWFRAKVAPGLRKGTRLLVKVERDGQLAGLGIAKNEPDERKICSARVSPCYANRGIGIHIIDELLKWLDKTNLTSRSESTKCPLSREFSTTIALSLLGHNKASTSPQRPNSDSMALRFPTKPQRKHCAHLSSQKLEC